MRDGGRARRPQHGGGGGGGRDARARRAETGYGAEMAEEEVRTGAARQAAAVAVEEEEARRHRGGGARREVPKWAAGAGRGLPVVEDVNAAGGGTPVDGTQEQEAAQEMMEGEVRTTALRRAAAVSARGHSPIENPAF